MKHSVPPSLTRCLHKAGNSSICSLKHNIFSGLAARQRRSFTRHGWRRYDGRCHITGRMAPHGPTRYRASQS